MLSIFRATLVLGALCTAASGQTIYPLDKAQILTGATFDLKVEFAGAPAAADLKVTINGEDAGKVLGRAAYITADEDGLGSHRLLDPRRATRQGGRYVVEATDGRGKSRVEWEVFGTPEGRLAKNVILLIGDGMSMAHRTAARMLSKGIVAGPLRRRARHGRHAPHGAGVDVGNRFHRHRQCQRHDGLYDRPQDRASTPSASTAR